MYIYAFVYCLHLCGSYLFLLCKTKRYFFLNFVYRFFDLIGEKIRFFNILLLSKSLSVLLLLFQKMKLILCLRCFHHQTPKILSPSFIVPLFKCTQCAQLVPNLLILSFAHSQNRFFFLNLLLLFFWLNVNLLIVAATCK